jgi:hypothetical protein
MNAWNQTAKLLSRNIAVTTRQGAALERNALVEANSFAVETDNFSSFTAYGATFFF